MIMSTDYITFVQENNVPDVNHVQFRDDIIEESYDLLLQQFKSSPNIVKLIELVGRVKSKLDDAVIELAKLRTINSAQGDFLDKIGEELGVPRGTATDEEYRVILKIRAFRTQTAGTRPQIIDLLSRVTGTDPQTIDTYVGRNKTFDIAFYTGCLNQKNAVDELVKIFPILSSYRLVAKAGKPLGFISVFEEVPTNPFYEEFAGFGSVFDQVNNLGVGGGHLGSLIVATP